MTRRDLERQQAWVYLGAIALGLVAGTLAPGVTPAFEAALWPSLVALLTVSFAQVPLDELPVAVRDRRFLGAILLGNFVAVPVLVGGLLPLAPDDPAVRLGVLLVLLVPCTDCSSPSRSSEGATSDARSPRRRSTCSPRSSCCRATSGS